MGQITLPEIHRIDSIIEMYFKEPFVFDNSEYECYEACKKVLWGMLKDRLIDFDGYDLYIEYITEKLGI